MKIELYEEIKMAVKDALKEFYKEIKNKTPVIDFHAQSHDTATENLLTVKQFAKKHPFVSEGSIRNKCFNSEWSKFNICISRVGRKILIKEKTTLEWFSNPPPEADWTYDKKKYGSKR